MGGKKVILAGATGMVGGCALRVCLDDPGVSRVTVIGRRSTGVEHAKWHAAQHTRQLILFLEKMGVTPDNPVTDDDLAGLPLPRGVWD